MKRLPRVLDAGPDRRSGSVIILTLWTLFFLAALAVAIGAHVSAGVRLAGSFRADSRAYQAARAGIEMAVAAAAGDTNAWDSANEDWRHEIEGLQAVTFGNAEFSILHTTPDGDGLVVTNAGLIDEECRISINAAGQQLLRSLLQVVGGMREDAASEVATAILDWRDADDDVLTGGAESDYYATLSGSYDCHSGPFDRVEELALVKGMGADALKRVRPVLSLYGSGRVNINSASATVLNCLAHRWGGEPDTTRSLVRKILSFRSAGGSFESGDASAVCQALGESEDLTAEETTLLKKMAKSVQVHSVFYGGYADARLAVGSQGQSRIHFVFDRNRQEKVYWHER